MGVGLSVCFMYWVDIRAVGCKTSVRQLSVWFSGDMKYQMAGIQMAGIACVGRIQKTGIWILQH